MLELRSSPTRTRSGFSPVADGVESGSFGYKFHGNFKNKYHTISPLRKLDLFRSIMASTSSSAVRAEKTSISCWSTPPSTRFMFYHRRARFYFENPQFATFVRLAYLIPSSKSVILKVLLVVSGITLRKMSLSLSRTRRCICITKSPFSIAYIYPSSSNSEVGINCASP